jgi:hypothetical protein
MQTFGGPQNPLSRIMVTTLGHTYELLVVPQTPSPEQELQPSDRLLCLAKLCPAEKYALQAAYVAHVG